MEGTAEATEVALAVVSALGVGFSFALFVLSLRSLRFAAVAGLPLHRLVALMAARAGFVRCITAKTLLLASAVLLRLPPRAPANAVYLEIATGVFLMSSLAILTASCLDLRDRRRVSDLARQHDTE